MCLCAIHSDRDASEGVLLKKVVLGCSGPQPHSMGVHPVGVAAFHEQVKTTYPVHLDFLTSDSVSLYSKVKPLCSSSVPFRVLCITSGHNISPAGVHVSWQLPCAK